MSASSRLAQAYAFAPLAGAISKGRGPDRPLVQLYSSFVAMWADLLPVAEPAPSARRTCRLRSRSARRLRRDSLLVSSQHDTSFALARAFGNRLCLRRLLICASRGWRRPSLAATTMADAVAEVAAMQAAEEGAAVAAARQSVVTGVPAQAMVMFAAAT
eukprot:scaffold81982_cov30-Phaeocystis_antarctica.AAC.2